jgi:protein gp37
MNAWGPSGTRQTFGAKHWNKPRVWNKQAQAEKRIHKVFSSSMCDLWEKHPVIDREREKLYALIADTPYLDWQLLTKRIDRVLDTVPKSWLTAWPVNVWIGASIENMDYAWRADELRRIRATVKTARPGGLVTFVSYEPALGPLDTIDLTGITWLIYGGESGPNYRDDDPAWPRAIRKRCKEFGTIFFYKQDAAPRTEMGIQLDGKMVRAYPPVRPLPVVRKDSLF